MALVAARTTMRRTPGTLDLREHLLLRMRGEAVYRHAVIVGELDGQHFWVLTPNRFIEKFDFGDKRLNAAKIWDGVTLPASLRLWPRIRREGTSRAPRSSGQ